MASFYDRYETALRRSTKGATVAGRLQGEQDVEIGDVGSTGDRRTVQVSYELYGPGDVRGLARGAITRRFPSPGANDAERTKLALVEFTARDLPWRYTPEPTAANLRPWIVLVVGTRTPGGIVERPDGRVVLGVAVQRDHVLAGSHRWAHVHDTGTDQVARVLCPKRLGGDEDGGTEYLACVVPAYTSEGADAWDGTAPVTVACYDRWSFRTGPAGDFPDLAGRLRKADPTAIEAAGSTFGRVDLRYRFRDPDPEADAASVLLPTAGALRLPHRPSGGPDPIGDPPPDEVGDEMAALSEQLTSTEGRTIIGPPRYERAFRPDPATDADGAVIEPEPTGWARQLRRDPRARGAAGLGAWAAIAWQERISYAAATKAGDLAIAQDRLRDVALGVAVSRSLWRRRLPDDPVAQLAVLAPMLGRLPAPTGEPGRLTTVLSEVVGRTPGLTKALLSSAARRALRPGPARTALAARGAADPVSVLREAFGCPEAAEDPADVGDHTTTDPHQREEAVQAAVYEAAGDDHDLANEVLEHLNWGQDVAEAALAAAFDALAPGPDGEPDRERIDRFLESREHEVREMPAARWADWVGEQAPEEACEPLSPHRLAEAVAGAVDPTVERPPAVRRVLATLPGVTRIHPLELEPELDLPLWSFLSAHAPVWLLPAADGLGEHEVVGLATNPAFVTAMLVGANHQAVGELRWRNLPLVSRWSPLRRFWQRPDGRHDITPIRGWPDDAPLGAAALLANGPDGEAVVAFRTPLFRRYPTTVVYLYPADDDWMAPSEEKPLTPSACQHPTFTGTIGDDLTFFGFAVPPDALARHWVVLEEPPSGHRFYHGDHVPPPAPVVDDRTARGFAYRRFALPVRVVIGPLL